MNDDLVRGKVPRHDLDAEAAVLSAVLLDASVLDIVRHVIGSKDAFYSDSNRRVYEAICSLHDAGDKVDIVTVAAWLRARDWLKQIDGGISYISQLVDATPSVAHVDEHANIVRDLSDLRIFQREAHKSAAMAYADIGENVHAFMSHRLEAMAHASEGRDEDDGIMLGALMEKRFQKLNNPEIYDSGIKIRTGFRALDRRMNVLKGGMVFVIGAHSGVGKTSLATNIAINVASEPGLLCVGCGVAALRSLDVACECGCFDVSAIQHHVLMFSPEMSEDELHDRIVFSQARAKMPYVDDYGKTHMSADSATKVMSLAKKLAMLPIKLNVDVFDLTRIRLKTLAHKRAVEKAGGKLALVVLDYLQLLKPGGSDQRKAHSREAEVTAMSRAAKELAKETGAVVIVLVQLNDDARKEKRKPRKEDIRESKAVAHDADKLVLIYNPDLEERANEYAEYQSEKEIMDCAELIIAKSRGGGKTGIVRVAFSPEYTLFDDWPEGVPMPERKQFENEGRRGRV